MIRMLQAGAIVLVAFLGLLVGNSQAMAATDRAAILGDCNMVGAALLPGFDDVGARIATHRMGGVVPLRLDRCFLRGVVCTDARVLDFGASDHRPMLIEVAAALVSRD